MKSQLEEILEMNTRGVKEDVANPSETSSLVGALQS